MSTLELELSEELEAELADRIDDTSFTSLEEYVRFVLREITDKEAVDRGRDEYDTEDVEERLEGLGYL